MGVWRRRLIVLLGIAAIAVGTVTAVDKYDERSCSGEVTVIRVGPLDRGDRYGACEGFLPW